MNFSRIVFIFVCLFVSSDLHATGQSGGSLMDTLLSLSRTVQPSIMFDQSKTLNDPKYAEVLKREEVVPPVYRSKPPKENCFVRLFKWVFGGCCRKARVEFQDDIDENSVSLSITTPSEPKASLSKRTKMAIPPPIPTAAVLLAPKSNGMR